MNKKIFSFFMILILGISIPFNCINMIAHANPGISYTEAGTEYDLSNAIHISSVKDLKNISEKCISDTWSRNKVFVLEANLDLSDSEFTSIPTFGGIFLGQGHTISGLSFSGGSNNTGLFRYVQESGEIYHLSISGTASAEGTHQGLSLLVGCNYGLISGCNTSGNITGEDQVGSIAGVNEISGVIMSCMSSGVVYGRHLVGGIAGENKGSILNSSNHCFVNTTASDGNVDLTNLELNDTVTTILTTENASSVTDVGGIAGCNSGIIRACTNSGSIGHPHVGYNVGGIAGSQVGYIEGCINYGLLNGRKDVGGIVGQMEPSSEMEYAEDTLKKLNTEFDKLHDLLTQLDRDASGASTALTNQINKLLASVRNAQSATDAMMTNVGDYFSDFSKLTDLTTLSSPKPISLSEIASSLATPSVSPSESPSVTPTATPTGAPTEAPTEAPIETHAETPIDAPDATPTATPAETPSDPFRAGWAEGWPSPSIDVSGNNYHIDWEKAEKEVNQAQQNVYNDASKLLSDTQRIAQSQAAILSSRIYSAQGSLSGSVSSIISDMEALNSMANNENQIILNDIQAIVDELNVITDLITDPDTTDPDDIITDVSDNDQPADTSGKVMNCTNNGKINGDLNVGGIAGSLSRENDIDPEDDFNLDSKSTNIRYKERIVIRQCENRGDVEGKRDCIGGIAGGMSLGSIIDCISGGTISSEGNMVGGIVGSSSSNVRSSSAKCTLKGANKIGGIAGFGTNISDCYSMIQIHGGENYLGSIAGDIDADAEISNNYFVEGCPSGIDGITREGMAEALSYEQFMESPDLPDVFQNLSLTFVADNKTVSVVTIQYGDTFDPDSLPDIPAKEGYAAEWSDFDQSAITFDQTIEAIYTEYISTLESSQTKGKRPVVLLEGAFHPEDHFTLSPINAYPDAAVTKSECWKLSLNSSSTGPFTVRYLIPEGMEDSQIEIFKNNNWYPVDIEIDGSYYIFTVEDANIVFCCVARPDTPIIGPIIVLVICVALLAVLIVITLRLKKRRGQRK
ncbi:MAG: PT domain-containing protein [Lachnospiraceae bacterium]|nr:PT domain-containing protein [Lachnospiraceae bacterium]